MTTPAFQAPCWARTRRSFDALVQRMDSSRLSFDEEELLRESHWSLGQDARLRDDVRFRPTPWGRWILTSSFLANDALFGLLHREPQGRPRLDDLLADLDRVVRRRCVFCSGDPRFVFDGGMLRLSARELTNQPLVEREIGDLEKYTTHLPIHSLRAAAASLPAGDWGRRSQEELIETLGWVKVSTGRKLNSRMFVARIEGNSMDDGRSGLVDQGYAIFEFWPSGTKQLLNVLVRGAFSDPETGNYAVKKYVADPRDAEGRHHRITLVSLNPDKERYPDIELDVENDDDVTVVAKVVQPLPPNQFERRPRPIRRPGRRDLVSAESVAEIAQDLAAHTERFFETMPSYSEAETEAARVSWRAELVCLEPEEGGLHLEAGPLLGLWTFVKQLRVRGAGWETTAPASNFRLRPTRITVPVGSGPWKWEAVGFEDDADVDLSALAVSEPSSDELTVFRVDAMDVGRQIATRVLSTGQRYRLLIPKPLLDRLADKPAVSAIGMGYGLWDIDLSSTVVPDVRAVLRELGIEIGEVETNLRWALVPPVAWGTSPRGVPYPRFMAEPSPVVVVDGPAIETEGAACLFLHGPKGSESLPLPSGRQYLARLHDLVPGQYSMMVLHDRTAVAPERVVFEVVTEVPSGPQARWDVGAKGAVATGQPGAISVMPAHDLAGLDVPDASGQLELSIAAPPGWPVRVSWRELAEDLLLTSQADSDGIVDACSVLSASRERRTRRSMGDLVLDFGELGAAELRHERRSTPQSIQARLDELVASRGQTAQRLAGMYLELLPIWFDQVCSALGYELELTAIAPASEPPGHVAAYRLLHTERDGSVISRHAVRVLVLVEDLGKALPESLLAWVDSMCAREGLRDALLSDGLRWAGHRRASRLTPCVWDLTTVAKDADECVAFLREASEGI